MRDLKGRVFGRLTVLGFSHYSVFDNDRERIDMTRFFPEI